MRTEENCAMPLAQHSLLAHGLCVSHHIFRDGEQAGYITQSSAGHYDAIALAHERFDLPESQSLFGSDLYAIVMRLHRIGCTVVPLNVNSTQLS